ncbi:glycoside hydrolase family 2 protein [Paenibacillus soyae]|uniref:Glycoside hydrolase family 2 n=1 Tax=Paenibacillus soyae TaxID=2969249 RepID=A0A9X2MPK2_9BACL|nr:glycoside hydrolase family 2 TIM barrel-domain containing protein [Paenibacillus soyae]MCR2803897.1 glycoside hydrolase family 2 [Paenibacillus soyae]
MRDSFCLNGEWSFMPLYGSEPDIGLPDELIYEEMKVRVPSSWRSAYVRPSGKPFGEIPEYDYAPFDVFGYPKAWNKADAGVLHRTFRLPDSMTAGDKRVFLRFDGIMQKAAVYLDRRLIAIWEDGYLPLRVEVSAWTKAGAEHHLHVVCGSFDKVTIPSGQKKITGLAGSWFGSLARGIWQDVYVESRPAASLADMTIRTSVRESRLEVDARLELAGPLLEDDSYKVRLEVRDADREPGSAPALSATASLRRPEDGEERDGCVSFRLDWAGAKLWNPDEPHLYRLQLALLDGGRVVDLAEERFGFREIWTEGPRFMLNGIPVNLRGDSWHFQGALQQTEDYVRSWYRMCKEAGVNCVRLHAEPHPSYYLDIADEEGMLIVDETAIYGSSKSMAADHPDFIANCKKHVHRLLMRDRNHPSVILWSLQNEMRWVDGRDEFKRHIPRMMDMIRELDPTRPIILEGDNRLLPKDMTEVESLHYNIDGTIAQWDRRVPLVFGEHGGWWYVCPQNSSMYVGLAAYRHAEEAVKGLAEKERLFVEYARRQGVTGISSFNFAHYFMRAMPERDIPLPPAALDTPGPKPKVIPKYSLTLNNGMLPDGYPSYIKNPAFDRMSASFKPVTIIPAEYNRSFFDDAPISRSFDVYNDTLHRRLVRIVFEVRQDGRLVHREALVFEQQPAERRSAAIQWTPAPVSEQSVIRLCALLYHEEEIMHELELDYKLHPALLRTEPVDIGRPAAYVGGDRDFHIVRALLPACERVGGGDIIRLEPETLLIAGSKLDDADGELEKAMNGFALRGGRVLLLEQLHLSLGKLALSRQPFFRAHAGSYDHPVLQGLGDDDLMFWHEELREEGPLPFISAAFEMPVQGSFHPILNCGAGDFGDGGDLWSPLLEYRGERGLFIANQLELLDNFHRVPQACLLLRGLLAYAGIADAAAAVRTGALAKAGGHADLFLRNALRLKYDTMDVFEIERLENYELLLVEPRLLAEAGAPAASALRRYAQCGGRVVVLAAEPGQEAVLSALLDRSVSIREQETFHLEADYAIPEARGLSPLDLFGFDKVFLSPREVANRPLAAHGIEATHGMSVLCSGVEGTAWKDYFVGQHTDEYSRRALIELNRETERPAGHYVLAESLGEGRLLLSQLLMEPASDKAVRLYTKLLANLGASFDDKLLAAAKGDEAWAVEKVMALPCPSHVDFEAMKAYYIDPAFSLNNLGEGLYGWMMKKERVREDGSFRIANPGRERWFLSCFVYMLEPGLGPYEIRRGRLAVDANCDYEIYMNGCKIIDQEQRISLKAGINRLIIIVSDPEETLRIRMVFLTEEGSYMRHLQYRLTIDEVEPK